MSGPPRGRRLPVGAEVMSGGAHFRVWAPDHASVTLVLEGAASRSTREPRELRMVPEENGYFSLLVPDAGAGTIYRFRLPGLPKGTT